MTKKFAKGDKVRLKKYDPIIGLSLGKTYTVDAVRDLLEPNKYYIDPKRWGEPELSWARNKTRLQIAGHPQLVFLKGVLHPKKISKDLKIRRQRSFSGAWFRKVAA